MQELSCPACRGTLARYDAPAATMHLCHRCGGAWLDATASERVANAVLSREALAHAHAVSRGAVSKDSGYRSAGRLDRDRPCPVCGETMTEVLFPRAPTHLDVCPDHGTFFDRDELVAVHAGIENEKASAEHRRRQLASIINRYRRRR